MNESILESRMIPVSDEAAEIRPGVQKTIDAVFSAAPGNQKVIIETMEYCRVSRTPNDLDVFMEDLLEHSRSVYRPVELRALLERHNALRYRPHEEESADLHGRDDPCEGCAIDAEGNLVIAAPSEGAWELTAEGLAYLDGDPLEEAAQKLLEKDARYISVYRKLLDLLAQSPKRKSDIEGVIESDPILQNPRIYTAYFLGECERIDAIEWKGAWRISTRGLKLLERLEQAG